MCIRDRYQRRVRENKTIAMAKGKTARADHVTREFTINLHKRLHSTTFKKRAPRAIRAIKKFATQMLGTTDVRVHPQLNKAVWAKGIKNVPHRVRVRCERRRNEDEDAKEKLFTIVTHVIVDPLAPKHGFTLTTTAGESQD
eukprot:TRINITY_DN2266_c0_g1_i3.p2 TRINITY_DN2266_c0_g1~~TRINITY_DN2266_c0_g1_i3.p2  ORF type:complete len:141 (+),score=39.99 TRINITY_DN2266_c0_g1_i3:131-553(+)